MVLAELLVRHTRRHMPTRRVALGEAYLPTGGPAYGAVLLGAIVAECLPELDPEQAELLARLVDEGRDGLTVPRIALRYRLQTDVHGLDRSRHRILAVGGTTVLELDRHGRPDPQVIGAVMAAAALPPSARSVAFRAVRAALARPGVLPEGVEVRRLLLGIPGAAPPPVGVAGAGSGGPAYAWAGVPADQRWAMEVLGLGADAALDRSDVQARFRRLVRIAHPDHGAADRGAAERMAELSEARTVLLDCIAATDVRADGGRSGAPRFGASESETAEPAG
ncbi:MAG: J domain-containing protein [Actinomycetota bacterium]